jgi:uncharacterized protein
MHGNGLPHRVDIARLGEGEHSWTGALAGCPLPRMDALDARVGDASATLTLTIDRGRPRLQGNCSAVVTLVCERCLAPVALDTAGAFDLVVVDRIEEADGYGADQPVVVAPKGQLDIAALIEDELILALPVIPTHDDTDCDGGQRQFGPAGEAAPARDNPFQALESLKRDDSGEVH